MTLKRKPRNSRVQPARTPKSKRRDPSLALPAPPERRRFRTRLLAWYGRHGRDLPWRRTDDPYHILVSEIMLQQTQVDRVLPKYGEWLAKYPSFEALAAAPDQQVVETWYPLGYNIRPRRLQSIAREAVAQYGGQLPSDEETLLSFKGIGAYTAGAIRSFAFRERAAILDTNVARVLFRVFVGRGDPKAHAMKRHLWRLSETLLPSRHVFDFNQALMDLGAMVCTPRSPGCLACPWAGSCEARRRNIAAELPRRLAAKAKPCRYGTVFWLERDDGAVLLRRRPDEGLLGGMIEVPSGPWLDAPTDSTSVMRHAPAAVDWQVLAGAVAHGFTHFDIELVVMRGRIARGRAPAGLWSRPEDFHRHAMPTLTKKVVGHVLGAGWGTKRRRAQATRRAVSG
jgi:A/G-specific adenine glycosylase